ncbi:MAG: hypothetical protein AAF191_02875 [Verrucomicrobiota bacterium]
MSFSQIKPVIESGKPFEIEVASGRVFRVKHQDVVAYSPNRTTLVITHLDSEGEETFSVVPLLTVVAAAVNELPKTS